MKFIIFIFIFSNSLCERLLASSSSDFKNSMKTLLDSAASLKGQMALLESAKKAESSQSLYWTPTSASLNLKNTLSGSANYPSDSTLASLNLNLYKFGSNQLAKEAAQANTRSQRAQLGQVKEDLELSASQLLFQLIRQSKNIEIQRRHLSLKEDSYQVAKERYKQGQLATQELEKVKMELESSKVSLAQAELDFIDTSNSIKTLADLEIPHLDWPFAISASSSKKSKKEAKDFFKVKAEFSNFEYRTLRSQQIWRESYLPTLDFKTEWGNSTLGSLNNGQWNSYLLLSIPLWDQMSGSSLSAAETGLAQAAKFNYDQALREANQKIKTLEKRIELSKSNVESSQRAAEKLQALRDDSLRRFRMGRSTVNDLLIDENRYLDAEAALLSSLLAYHLILIEACHVQGESVLDCY